MLNAWRHIGARNRSKMNDSSARPSRPRGVALFGTLALAAVTSCGGRATTLEAGDAPSNEEAPEEMPPTFEVLELRRLYPEGGGYVLFSSTTLLAPAELARVQDAYRQVRASSAEECASAGGSLTLGVEIDREELLFAGDDRAGCPAPGVESSAFVSGLPELYALLAAMRDS